MFMMKRLLAAGSICVFLFLGVIGCGGESMAGYQKIPAAEAKNMMDKGKKEKPGTKRFVRGASALSLSEGIQDARPKALDAGGKSPLL